MDIIFPSRDAVTAHGWTHQVQWIEDGRPCFIRCKSGRTADDHADKLQRQGLNPVVVDLNDAMQLN